MIRNNSMDVAGHYLRPQAIHWHGLSGECESYWLPKRECRMCAKAIGDWRGDDTMLCDACRFGGRRNQLHGSFEEQTAIRRSHIA